MKAEHESFIKDFLESIIENKAAIFAGAGLSVGAGYVDWKGLLKDAAEEIGLDVKKEDDLISLAQFHYNENGGRSKLNKKILKVFTDEVEATENHGILSRLPIDTFWTTNYDSLIEDSLESYNKIVDVKHENGQLPNSTPKRDVTVYKMHGDVKHAHDAIITRDDYEKYFRTHDPFVTTLKGDLTTKTFLFIGFSFSDPNLDYALSRVRLNFHEGASHHYCFVKTISEEECEDKAEFDYKTRRQELLMNDLKTYQILPVIVNSYSEITDILSEIERRYKLKSVFISGSAEEYGEWGRDRAIKLIHKLSSKLISKNYRIVNGFGWGIGSAVINGALEQIYLKPKKYSEDQLIVKPFPQFATGEKELPELWQDYRERMISLTGIAIFLFGNKIDHKAQTIVNAGGVRKEFDIAVRQGCIPIPIHSTGYISKELWDEVLENTKKYFLENDLKEDFESLLDEFAADKIIQIVIRMIEKINKK
ncbi:hypothetical protein ERX46_01680 [Brumimicrobium glaciale]|uniref:NAD(+) hydrolase ThsA n=1 Tax=Brumimicrobium glaciale TaxID=200475 RepID=A0A4Q4KQC7_9FLAO|nr:SIR2 family protein [Brumimicrobium glaciale]RYM35730.1 hypothetical protein ERX46_01680 [Brumimicrobium glaciale]